jgi:flagellar motor switch protein FliG
MVRLRSNPTTVDPAAMRKAAIVVATLDRDAADALLERMTPDEAQRVRRAVVALGEIPPTEQEEVLSQFIRQSPMVPDKSPPGIELDDRLAQKLSAGARQPSLATGEPAPSQEDAPFRFLHEAQCDDLADLLRGEHPQTVAIVLAHLPPERAADLVGALPQTLRVDALRRLAALEQTDQNAVRDVEQVVQTWLRRRVDAAKRTSGVAAVASILRAAPAAVQVDLLSHLGKSDQKLADSLGTRPPNSPAEAPPPAVAPPPTISVEQLDALAGPVLAAALAAMDHEIAALALAGAAPGAVERALGALSRDQQARFRRSLADLGAISLRDVDAARQELALRVSQNHVQQNESPTLRRAG